MKVELLWFSGCPNWRETDERLRFRGSPTVLVEGRDPFAEESDPVGLSCRVFGTPGGLRGAPTVEQLVEVLRAAA